MKDIRWAYQGERYRVTEPDWDRLDWKSHPVVCNIKWGRCFRLVSMYEGSGAAKICANDIYTGKRYYMSPKDVKLVCKIK